MSGTNNVVPTEALDPAECKGLADVLMSVGDKWTILVVGALSRGQLRYNEIQRRVSGISQRMLTLTLKRLEADGIVTRTLFPSVPPRVDYELTELGSTLRGALVPLHLWAARNKQVIAENRRKAGPAPRRSSNGAIHARSAMSLAPYIGTFSIAGRKYRNR